MTAREQPAFQTTQGRRMGCLVQCLLLIFIAGCAHSVQEEHGHLRLRKPAAPLFVSEWKTMRLRGGARLNASMEPSYRAGKPTIWAAARVGDNATLWKGLETIPVDKPDADGRSALHWAVSCNRTELVEALLSRGANALVRDELGWMPLHSAGSVGNVRILQKLVEAAGSDECINIKSTDAAEVSILHLVCSKGRLECLEWLLEQQGIEMEAEDADQATPLHVSLDPFSQQERFSFSALEHAEKTFITPDKARACVIWWQRAACAGHMACVDLLVERGADINNQCAPPSPLPLFFPFSGLPLPFLSTSASHAQRLAFYLHAHGADTTSCCTETATGTPRCTWY